MTSGVENDRGLWNKLGGIAHAFFQLCVNEQAWEQAARNLGIPRAA
ncbi:MULTISPECIES: hypothetical protein [Pseudomonas]|uniref:Uncharacterized protein n=1 Tax=Pseudomonas putida TaxID=303 RepID=A0A7W2L3K2_PSEPU|nr:MULTISPECIES: hypothetical protein [Pseudomonas]MBA6117621.1 hypothetical protein [Pseudomonas putida]QNL89586.1 Uncharacterized protein PPKH_4172 [Pseudomonas putida]